MILITHDLGVIAQMADRLAVMYAGRVVEQGTTREVLAEPRHPYTQGLIASRPVPGQRLHRLYSIPGRCRIWRACQNTVRLPSAVRRPPLAAAMASRRCTARRSASPPVSSTLEGARMSTEPLVEVKGLKKYFPLRDGLFGRTSGQLKAVDDVSFSIRKGRIFGLVGESGSGKTTVGRTLLGLHDKTAGEVMFKGQALDSLSKEALRALRPKMQLVFQDPYSSLNSRLRVGDAIGEALLQHGLASKAELRERVLDTLSICGLSPQHYGRFPHEFSGGQRQRIGIARALILQPEFIIADEPISALDVSIQAQIINLFSDLQERQG